MVFNHTNVLDYKLFSLAPFVCMSAISDFVYVCVY